MTDLTIAFGTNHGIGGGTSVSNEMNGMMFVPPRLALGSTYQDLSGSGSLLQFRPKALDLTAYQSGEIIEKFREFQTLAGDRKATLRSLEEKLAEIKKLAISDESISIKLDAFHNLLLDDCLTPQDQFQALQAARKAYFDAQRPVVDARIERLQKEINQVREELEYAETNLGALRAFLTTGVRQLIPEDRIRNNLCPVCMENDINRVLVPCGHTLCLGCSDQIGTKCMTCRATITKVMPVFFSI
jgi:hypothetical protein